MTIGLSCRTWTPNAPYQRYAHYKYDGIQLTITNMSGNLRCWTRTPDDLASKMPVALLKPFYDFGDYITVYGELYVPGEPASHVKSALAHDPSQLRFAGFATDNLPGDATLSEVNFWLERRGIETIAFTSSPPNPHILLDNLPENAEGVVLKNANKSEFYKLKKEHTADLIVVNVTEGKGRFTGQVGSLVCALYDGPIVANVSGMDDVTRALACEDDIGRVCEVKYQYVGAGGRLRHPVFVRWRDDKPPKECTKL